MLTWTDFLAPDVKTGVEAFIASQHEQDGMAVVVNAIVRDWLTAQGLLPYQELPEGETDPDA